MLAGFGYGPLQVEYNFLAGMNVGTQYLLQFQSLASEVWNLDF